MEPATGGMSVRTWLAGLAMQGLLARGRGPLLKGDDVVGYLADDALRCADALIAALKEKKP